MAKLLIVDDSPQMAHLLKEMTGIIGHESYVAHSGAEGLSKVTDLGPELILLDIMMPHMNGWEFLEQLRGFSETPVIFISADDSGTSRAKAKKLGAADFLSKGVSPAILQSKINAVLNSVVQLNESQSPKADIQA